jgi:hypothetical protein
LGESNVSGGSVHPGKPIIWPTGKSASSTPVESSPQTQVSGGVKAPAAGTQAPSEVAAPALTAPATTAGGAQKTSVEITRPLTVDDLKIHLLNNQIPDTDFNVKLASLMLNRGVELSRMNFVKVLTMMEGTDKGQPMQEAAIISLLKGIDNPQAVKELGEFLAKNPQLAQQLSSLQLASGNLQSVLGMAKGLLSPTLIAQLGALLGQFEETFKSFNDKYTITGDNSLGRSILLNDARALKALLEGIQQQAPASDSPESEALSSNFNDTISKLDSTIRNLTSQTILSQPGREEVNYLYHQIPNFMTNPPKNFEIVIKRDGEGKEAVIDPNNTQLFMSFETENMGKMVVSMIVKNKKVYLVFVFSEKEYGDEAREKIPKEFAELQKKLTEKDFIITGYQVKVDKMMTNIKPYLIPLMPRLGEILKKIDVEA